MSKFLEEQKQIAAAKKAEYREKTLSIKEGIQNTLDALCAKYEPLIIGAIEHNAKKGRMEFYMNFVKEDFIIKGSRDKPSQNCVKVLEMLTEEGKTLHGLNFSVWNNGKFTTHFWMDDRTN
jgi:hypothetical protein